MCTKPPPQKNPAQQFTAIRHCVWAMAPGELRGCSYPVVKLLSTLFASFQCWSAQVSSVALSIIHPHPHQEVQHVPFTATQSLPSPLRWASEKMVDSSALCVSFYTMSFIPVFITHSAGQETSPGLNCFPALKITEKGSVNMKYGTFAASLNQCNSSRMRDAT